MESANDDTIQFKLRWLDEDGHETGFLRKKGKFDGETLVLDDVQIPVSIVTHVETHESRVILSAISEDGETVTIETLALGGPGTNVTVGVSVSSTVPVVAVAMIVFTPSSVETRLPVVTPRALVDAPGCVSMLPVPVAVKVTSSRAIGLLLTSRSVIVTVELSAPSATTPAPGLTVTDDAPALIAPGVKVITG